MLSDIPRRSNIVSDRGPTPYFHGRAQILHDFKDLVRRAKDTVEGRTTFLIQGAPGVGKTALLDQCKKLASRDGWHVANIKTGALWDKGKMLRTLGFGKLMGVDNVSLSLLEAFTAEISLSKPARSTTSLNVVEKRKRKPLLLVLDEAQRLSNANELSKAQFDETGDLLEAIHNGELNKPVILLAAGLGTTIEAFGALGISRFAEGCVVELGALSKESERAVIQDWLVKEGGAKGDPAPWIHAIAQQTHRWPRHVHSYARHAAEHLKEKGGLMTPQGLKIIMELGEEGRKQYYKQRVSKFRGDQLQCLMKSMGEADKGKTARYKVIMSSMVDEYGREEAKNLFDLFIEKGILEEYEEGYAISIPSMHTWLNEKYGLERTEPTRERKARPTPPKDFGMER